MRPAHAICRRPICRRPAAALPLVAAVTCLVGVAPPAPAGDGQPLVGEFSIPAVVPLDRVVAHLRGGGDGAYPTWQALMNAAVRPPTDPATAASP